MLKKMGFFLLWALLPGRPVCSPFGPWHSFRIGRGGMSPPMFLGWCWLCSWCAGEYGAGTPRACTRGCRRMPRQRGDEAAEVDQDWNAGLGMRASHLSRMGSPLYVLPWFLMLGKLAVANDLIPLSGLPPRCGQVTAVKRPAPAANTLRLVVLDAVFFLNPRHLAMHSDASPEWRRLLYWLLRSRRREPLNGVMLVIDAHSLLTESGALGCSKVKICAINSTTGPSLGARLRYFIITGAQAIPGLLQWGQALTPAQRQQPLGLLSQQRSQGATAFLDEVFTGLAQRMADLRISLGVRRLTRRASVQPARADHHLAPEAGKITHPSLRCQSVQRAGTCFRVCFSPRAQKMPKGGRRLV